MLLLRRGGPAGGICLWALPPDVDGESVSWVVGNRVGVGAPVLEPYHRRAPCADRLSGAKQLRSASVATLKSVENSGHQLVGPKGLLYKGAAPP